MSTETVDNPFRTGLEALAVECDVCAHRRKLAAKAQELMDEVHRGMRVTVIPPVECHSCDEGWRLTKAGVIFAVLAANYIDNLKRLAEQEKLPF